MRAVTALIDSRAPGASVEEAYLQTYCRVLVQQPQKPETNRQSVTASGQRITYPPSAPASQDDTGPARVAQ